MAENTGTVGATNPQTQRSKSNAETSPQTLNDKLKALLAKPPEEGEPPVFEQYRYGADVPLDNDIRQYLKPEVDSAIFAQMYDHKWVRHDELGKAKSRLLTAVKKDEEMSEWFKDEAFGEDGTIGLGAYRNTTKNTIETELILHLRTRYEGNKEIEQATAFWKRRNFGITGADSDAQSKANDEANKVFQGMPVGDKSRVIDQSRRYISTENTRPAQDQVQASFDQLLKR